MARLTATEYTEWLRMRKHTMVIFFIQTILTGMDFSLTFLTLWVYLKELVKTDHPILFYSIISVSFLFPSLTLTGIVGHFVDRRRNVRLTFLIINTIVIIGNLIYALPYSPWLLITGRLFAGVGGPLRSVMAGEISRSYTSDELSSKLAYMGMAYSLGFVLGPISNLPFKDVDTTLVSWRITYVNVCGVYMAIFFAVVQILSLFMLHDLSKIYDLKMDVMESTSSRNLDNEVRNLDNDARHQGKGTLNHDIKTRNQENNESDLINNKSSVKNETSSLINKQSKSAFEVFKQLLRSFDGALVLYVAFFQSYFAVSFDMWLPLLVIERMRWQISALNVIMTGTGVAAIISCLFMICCSLSKNIVYKISIITQLGFILMEIITLVFFHYNKNIVLDIILWVPYCAMYALFIVVQEVFLVCTLAEMVSSKYQVFADGIRLTVYRLGAMVALATSALIFEYIDIVAVVHCAIMFSCFVLMIVRRKTLTEPKMVIL